MNIDQIVEDQRVFFKTDATKPLEYRLAALKKLRAVIKKNEANIYAALKDDLNKSEFESYMTEIGMVYEDLSFQEKHLPKWIKPQRVRTPLAQFHARSFVISEPYGVALIMSPWNYPFLLTISPLIAAIAAGNCAVVKPSAYSPRTTQVIADIVAECFPSEYVTVVQGGRSENAALLEQRFDYIFFTGSVAVGRLVMEKAAKYLTPISLELGGKSPCIIDKSADLKLAAKRLAFGKLVNAGQTCIAPDYLFVHKDVKEELVVYLQQHITEMLGSSPLDNPDFPHIINEKQFNRLVSLIGQENVLFGGKTRGVRQIEPTLLDNITAESKIMQEEIFGPVLPIMTYSSIDEVVDYVVSHEKPLALYLFTGDKAVEKRILSSVSFGGGCINDTIVHIATSYMGFGGVGNSGTGAYHGKKSFETFTHQKSVMKRYNWIDLPMKYHPYQQKYLKLIKGFLR